MAKIKNINQNSKFKKIFLFLIFTTYYLLTTTYYPLFAQDKIVAIVNKDIITQKDLNDFINFMRVQLSTQYQGKQLESKIQSMKLDLLDKLIEDRLILQKAKKDNMGIDPDRIKAKINEIKKEIGRFYEQQFGKNLIFVIVYGSWAFGLNLKNSDVDIMGVCSEKWSKKQMKNTIKFVKKLHKKYDLKLGKIKADVKKIEKDKAISEDDSFKSIEESQKLTDKYTKKIDEILLAKEKEIAEV